MNRPLVRPEIAWPAFVIALLLFGVASTFGVLFFSGIDGGPAVVDNYYAEGVAWDSVATSRARVDRLGWNVELSTPQTAAVPTPWPIRYRILDAAGHLPRDADFGVRIYRPDRSAAVAGSALSQDADSSLSATIAPLTPGLWDFELFGTVDGQSFTHRQRRELY